MTPASRGVALISVLALLAAASLLLAVAVERFTLGLTRFELVRAEAAAWQAIRAGEALIWHELEARMATPIRVGVDSWTSTPLVRTLGQARLECALRDLTEGFNVNNLLSPKGEVQTVWVDAWSRLLEQARGGPGLVDALLDWQDADDERRAGPGSEQSSYRQAGQHSPIANRALADVSQLKLVLGMNAELYARLANWVVALPEPTAVNVNLAPEAVLQALEESWSPSDVTALMAARPFTDAEQLAAWFVAHALEMPTGSLAVSSHYLAIDCEYQGESARLRTSHAVRVKPDEALQSLGRRALPPQREGRRPWQP